MPLPSLHQVSRDLRRACEPVAGIRLHCSGVVAQWREQNESFYIFLIPLPTRIIDRLLTAGGVAGEIDVAHARAADEVDNALNIVNAVGEDFVCLAGGDRVVALLGVILPIELGDLVVTAVAEGDDRSIFINECFGEAHPECRTREPVYENDYSLRLRVAEPEPVQLVSFRRDDINKKAGF